MGTLINTIAIIIGGILGLLFKSKLEERFQNILINANGLCVIFLGISGCLQEINDINNTTNKVIMMIICFSLGSLIGELLNIEKHLEEFGSWLKQKTKSEKDNTFIDGFVAASLTVCIGAMAVVGAIQDGVDGNYSTLLVKAILDFIIIMVMSASLGKGCIFSFIPVLLFQGSITLLSRYISPYITYNSMSNLNLTGNMLIFCIGVNLMFNKKIKVANMLPTIFLASLWALIF